MGNAVEIDQRLFDPFLAMATGHAADFKLDMSISAWGGGIRAIIHDG